MLEIEAKKVRWWRRFRFRISIRGLIVLVLLVGGGLGWIVHTSINDAGLAPLAGFQALTDLGLHGCHEVTDAGMRYLRGLPNLENLDLVLTHVGDEGVSDLATCPKLAR